MATLPIDSLDTREIRKARGAFFTPDALARFVVDWAVRSGDDRVVEPSCGDAIFLAAAGERLRSLGHLLPSLAGYDVHGPSLDQARSRLRDLGLVATLRESDFFEVEPEAVFDVVIGNPPYVRYQDFSGGDRARGLEAAARHGVKLPQLANAWAAFVVHAAQFLKPDGRLGLVLPAVLLTVNYAAPIRRFLLERFQRVRLVTFRERVFPGVQEEVVLLLAEGTGRAGGLEIVQLDGAADLAVAKPPRSNLVVVSSNDAKWTGAFLSNDSEKAFGEAISSLGFETLGTWGEVELGMVTGNNGFFSLSAADVARWKLRKSDLVRIVPTGSAHLRGLTFSRRLHDALTEEGERTYLFHPKREPSERGLAFIKSGEELGIDQGYKCRNRRPWWRVPLVAAPDLIFTYMSGKAQRLISNDSKAHVLNSLHGVRLSTKRRAVGKEMLPLACLNTVTLLGAELVGRSYGGGVLKLEPREARRLFVPGFEALAAADELRAIEPQAGAFLRAGDVDGIAKLVDEALLVRQLGLPRPHLRQLRQAWRDLRDRRESRGKGPP